MTFCEECLCSAPRRAILPLCSPLRYAKEVLSWQRTTSSPTSPAFEPTSKRRKGYPSETRVKRGQRVVHGNKELYEKLGRNDLCLCGSGRRFQGMLPPTRAL
jgi:hypothetical protein